MRDMEAEKSLLVREESEHVLDAFRQLEREAEAMEKDLREER